MNKESYLQVLEDLQIEKNIELSDIPSMDLYMDQVTTLFEQRLSHEKRNSSDKLLTKTMINNYTKNKLLKPAKKKKYTKDHIIQMILLYELKQVVSMEDIKKLFSTIDIDENKTNLESIYQKYLDCKKTISNAFSKEALLILDETKKNHPSSASEGSSEENDVFLTALLLFQTSVYYKRLGEKMIDDFFNAD
ncbi:MAG: DUF1836 domain-containing protein [Eubacteriaceae bacterium]